ncbi:MAG: amidohydrolase [Oscillospiraceae bacterium]|nr:amidohydrolase [Oscillospiraceae bacterium]
MLLINAKIMTMEDAVIDCGYIQIKDDKIIAVGDMSSAPQDDNVLDLQGKMVYPGFIDAHCHMGMAEEGLDFEGDDLNEMTDPVSPHLRGLDAINPVNQSFPEAVDAGVTTVVTGPGSANAISGQFCAIKTYGKRVDKMVLREPVAMKFALGENPKKVYNDKSETPMTRMATAALIREELSKAKRYLEDVQKAEEDPEENDPPEFDAKKEALIPVLKRELKAHIHCHRSDDIFTAVRLAEEFELDYVLIHCTEGHLIADELKEIGAPVVNGPLMCTRTKPELLHASDKTPGILSKAGLQVAICTDYNVIPIWMLPITAGYAVREGMDYMEALKAITINPARICGIEDRVGSVKVGKDADLLVYSQDPLTLAAKPDMVFINGKQVK